MPGGGIETDAATGAGSVCFVRTRRMIERKWKSWVAFKFVRGLAWQCYKVLKNVDLLIVIGRVEAT